MKRKNFYILASVMLLVLASAAFWMLKEPKGSFARSWPEGCICNGELEYTGSASTPRRQFIDFGHCQCGQLDCLVVGRGVSCVK